MILTYLSWIQSNKRIERDFYAAKGRMKSGKKNSDFSSKYAKEKMRNVYILVMKWKYRCNAWRFFTSLNDMFYLKSVWLHYVVPLKLDIAIDAIVCDVPKNRNLSISFIRFYIMVLLNKLTYRSVENTHIYKERCTKLP